MTEDEVRSLLLERAKPFARNKGSSGVTGWCIHHQVPRSRATEFLRGTRAPAKTILDALGLEWRICGKVPDAGDEADALG